MDQYNMWSIMYQNMENQLVGVIVRIRETFRGKKLGNLDAQKFPVT